jgi:benzodiazapine receptor
MNTLARQRWQPVAAAAVSALIVALLGGLITVIGPWYYALQKPSWQPPDWLFGPAWTLIFALSALAGVAYWRHETSAGQRRQVILAFVANGLLNTLWSLFFFRLQRPDWALYEVGALWLSIVCLIALTGRASREAAWLLVPYLAWVSFASVLNWRIVALNGPFSGG